MLPVAKNVCPSQALSRAMLDCEQAVLTDPYSPKQWILYLNHLTSSPALKIAAYGKALCVFERAVAALPSSYKLWVQYAAYTRDLARETHPLHPTRAHARSVALRAARSLPHCPVLWETALRLHVEHCQWTCFRPVVDEATRELPLTLHGRLWKFVSQIVEQEHAFPLLAAHFLSRWTILLPSPDRTVQLFRVLKVAGKIDQAVTVLASALSGEKWGGDDRRGLWMELVEIAVRNPRLCVSIDVPALVRGAIDRSEAEVAELWVALAEVYTRLGRFHESRQVYEEALVKVTAVRDFVLIFDAYAKFLESLLEAAMEDADHAGDASSDDGSEDDDEGEEGSSVDDVDKKQATSSFALPELSLETILSDLEGLANRRPLLLSNVRLRQNPNNVHEWHKRAALFKRTGDSAGAVDAYTDGVNTVDPWRASHGRPHTLWLAFARLYEDANDISSARKVLNKATSDPERFKAAEDLATIWCEFAEMELRQTSPEAALELLRRATSPPLGFEKRKVGMHRPPRTRSLGNGNVDAQVGAGAGQIRITHEYDTSSPAWLSWKSPRLWAMYLDMQESVGTTTDVQGVHDKMLELGIATVETIVAGAAYLESKRLYEGSFRLLDRGTSFISWPDALAIWVVYLQKFVERYGGRKLERLRDLFEEAIRAAPVSRKGNTTIPNSNLHVLYLLYASTEERYGLARHALTVYGRAVKSVRKDQRAGIYRLYIVRVAELFGATKTRDIYEDAIESLQKRDEIIEFSLRYAAFETRMGEIDRARAVYVHGAQVADPRGGPSCSGYWSAWNSFELAHGSEDTFRDMLRTKRLVQMQNAGIHLVTSVAAGAGTVEAAAAAAGIAATAPGTSAALEGGKSKVADSAMAELERKVLEARAAASEPNGKRDLPGVHEMNSEEIAVDLDDDESEDKGDCNMGNIGARSPLTSSIADHPITVDVADGTYGGVRNTAVEIEERPVPAAVMSLAGISSQTALKSDEGNEEGQGSARAEKALGARERLKRKRQG
jgi:pre-mRNA-splicing factor SYF1